MQCAEQDKKKGAHMTVDAPFEHLIIFFTLRTQQLRSSEEEDLRTRGTPALYIHAYSIVESRFILEDPTALF